MNMPENREYVAEIMFETFNVKGLYIAVQVASARLSLAALFRLHACVMWSQRRPDHTSGGADATPRADAPLPRGRLCSHCAPRGHRRTPRLATVSQVRML